MTDTVDPDWMDAVEAITPPPAEDDRLVLPRTKRAHRHRWERRLRWPAKCVLCGFETMDPDAHFWPPDGDEEVLPDDYKCPDGRLHEPGPATHWVCSCGVIQDPEKSRRGKSSRRLGHDGERRSERRYGWKKIGEFGGITDLEGRLFIVQQKTTRTDPPVAWKSIFAKLEQRAGGKIPLILRSFVRQGVDTEDFVILRGRDWLALHGRDEAE